MDGEGSDLGDAIGSRRLPLARDPVPEGAPKQDVRAPVLERLVPHDLAGAADLEDGRPARAVGRRSRVQELDADEPVAGERVREHGPVPGLEDVKRESRLRQKQDVREREEREKDGCGHGRENDAD